MHQKENDYFYIYLQEKRLFFKLEVRFKNVCQSKQLLQFIVTSEYVLLNLAETSKYDDRKCLGEESRTLWCPDSLLQPESIVRYRLNLGIVEEYAVNSIKTETPLNSTSQCWLIVSIVGKMVPLE